MSELQLKYRPRKLDDVVGQDDAVRILKGKIGSKKIPKVILLSGPSGVGKTTIARILAKKHLKCSDTDFYEVNAADDRGIDEVRNIKKMSRLRPMGGKNKVFLLDEVHMMMGPAQTALLKLLEEPPSTAYFMLATTDPQKIIKTVRGRCSEIVLKAVSLNDLVKLIKRVAKEEEVKISDEVAKKIANVAEGSARKALVILNQVCDIEDEEDQLSAIEATQEKGPITNLAKALLFGRPNWADISRILKSIETEDPEAVRRMVVGYTLSVMLNNKNPKHCAKVLYAFRDPFFDSGRANFALLVGACAEIVFS